MSGVCAKLPKKYFRCSMCKMSKFTEVYIYGSFVILPHNPYYELEICNKCAKRENKNLNKIIDERTEQWLKKQK